MGVVQVGVMQAAGWRKYAGRIACLIALGALLAGCDKCGDWWSPMRGDSQVCKQTPPSPQ
jgi:hypothetical protein